MRNRALAVLVLTTAMTVAAQQTTPQTPPASGAEVQTPAGKAQSTTPQGQGMAHPHRHGQAAGAPGMQADMAAHMEKMRATLEQMKANIAKVKDANVRQALQADADLWSHMVEHMQQMQARMQAGGGHPMMHGGGKGMGHGEGCCCAGMMKKEGPQGSASASSGGDNMAAGMGSAGGMSCGKGGAGCCGGGEGGCCGGHGGNQSQTK